MVKTGGPRPVKAVISYPARALGTIYQNTTGRPILVLVDCTCNITADAGSSATFCSYVKATSPPDTVVMESGINYIQTTPSSLCCHAIFMVPPGYYYRVVATQLTGGTVVLAYWAEIEL